MRQRPGHPVGPALRADRRRPEPGPALDADRGRGLFSLSCAARLAVVSGAGAGSDGSSPTGCRAKAPVIDAPFHDDFERAELGADWNATAPAYRVAGGKLDRRGRLQPSRLAAPAAARATPSIDAGRRRRSSPAGDIKLELFGDGESFDPDKGSYTSTGYVLIFGGWNNSLSVICRQEEHGGGRKAERADIRVEPGRSYHFTSNGGAARSTGPSTASRSWPGPIRNRWPAPATSTWPSTTGRPTSASTTSHDSPRPPDDNRHGRTPEVRHSISTTRWPAWAGGGRCSSTCTTTRIPTRSPRRWASAPRWSTSSASTVTLAHGGIVGRAQNRAMVENLKLRAHARSSSVDPGQLRHHRARRQPARDRQQLAAPRPPHRHRHRPPPAPRRQRARRPGATSAPSSAPPRRSSSTTCGQRAVPIDAPLATAFFFALRTETRDLGREATEAERRRLPGAGAARRSRPALPDDPSQGSARALRGPRPRAALRRAARRPGRCEPRRRSAIPTSWPRSPTCCSRTRARASCSASGSTRSTRTCRCGPRPSTPAPARFCATSSATTAPRVDTARWRARGSTRPPPKRAGAAFEDMVRRLLVALGLPVDAGRAAAQPPAPDRRQRPGPVAPVGWLSGSEKEPRSAAPSAGATFWRASPKYRPTAINTRTPCRRGTRSHLALRARAVRRLLVSALRARHPRPDTRSAEY